MKKPNTKAEKKRLIAAVRQARNRLSEIEAFERRTENEKLVGKCFKYRNSYSMSEKESDYWFIYTFIQRVDSDGGLREFSFQTDCNGDIQIQPDHWNISMLSGYEEISASELRFAWSKLIRRFVRVEPPES